MALKPLFRDIDSVQPVLEQGAAILTPNRRLSRAVREAEHRLRAGGGARSWDSTTIMPLRQYWLDVWRSAGTRGRLPPRVVLDVPAQQLLWRRIIADDSRQFSLLSEDRAAALCQQAAEQLALWQLDPREPGLRQQFGFDEDGRAFLRWHGKFREALADLGVLTAEMAAAELLQRPAVLEQPLATLHLDDLPPLYQALCAAAPYCTAVCIPETRGRCLPTRVFTDSRGELEAAARWCSERVAADPDGRYAVVLSDMEGDRDRLEYLLRREFGCLTRNYQSLPVNFATGFSLDRLPIIRDALRILALAREEVRVEDVIALLHSRFVAPLPFSPAKRETAVRRLRELCREQIPQRVMREVLQPAVSDSTGRAPWEQTALLEGVKGLHRRRRTPSQWLALFAAILEAWQWGRGRALDSLEYQQINQWQEVIDSFAGLDPVTGAIGFGDALARLRELLAAQSFQPRTADSAVQVLGPLETTGLSFDGLWVTGLTAARWPASARPNPYIPNRVQRDHRMPHADAHWEWSWASQRWAHWMRGAKEFQASFVNQADGAEQLPSPLLRELSATAPEDTAPTDSRWLAQCREAVFDDVDPGRVALLETEAAADGVGSQVLEQQSLCPFQAFAAARLAATPPPEYAAGLLPSERGTLLHRALYFLFGEITDSADLEQLSAERQDLLIDEALGYARSAVSPLRRDVLGSDVLLLEYERLRSLLQQWLAIERDRGEPFTVITRESEREIVLAGLKLRLRVDRIDRLGDGSELILDYKSGAADGLKRWFGERPSRPQLPLYALLEPPASAIAYASLKPGKLGFSGVGEHACAPGIGAAAAWVDDTDDEDDEPMAVLRAGWRDALESLAREFMSGDSRVEPTIDGCRYCQRFSLCRLGEILG